MVLFLDPNNMYYLYNHYYILRLIICTHTRYLSHQTKYLMLTLEEVLALASFLLLHSVPFEYVLLWVILQK